MQRVKIGDQVQFKYHNKIRNGRVERTWPSVRRSSGYRDGGFCIDHGDHYKSYSTYKVQYLAKIAS